MIKNIIRESIIVILILIVIILALGIVFYDYIPMNKIIPTKVEAYQISNELKEELDKQIIENANQTITKTYTVEAEELKQYEKNDEYDKGRNNPFSSIKEETDSTTQNQIVDIQPNINSAK